MNEDDIIDFFTKGNRYYDRFDEKNWRQQMEEHPLLMTKAPDDPNAIPPLVEAIRQLKYSEECNTPQELAKQYKLDGNENFKLRKFEDAAACYTKGMDYLKTSTDNNPAVEELEVKEKREKDSNELYSVLYSNRAACYVMLNDYPKAIQDCEEALNLNPNNQRAKQRMIETKEKLC